jgi:hypothetical protein
MEQQRERPSDVESSEEQNPSETLPPPPTAFPIAEFSRFQSQLLDTPITNQSSISLQTDSERNPFGDSNAVSRGSFASTTASHPENPFRSREGDEQSFRDDASSLAPPPEYEDLQASGGAMRGGAGRRVSVDAPLPSYTTAIGEGTSVEEKQGGQNATLPTLNARRRTTEIGFPDEKADHDRGQDDKDQRQQQDPRNAITPKQQRDPAELAAITDAISRAYASSPSLDNQRYTRSSSRPTSRSGTANRGEGSAFGTAGSSQAEVDEKGKRRESQNSSAEEDVVEIEGRRMSKTMAAELFQMWDNIDRAHGNRESPWISVLAICD